MSVKLAGPASGGDPEFGGEQELDRLAGQIIGYSAVVHRRMVKSFTGKLIPKFEAKLSTSGFQFGNDPVVKLDVLLAVLAGPVGDGANRPI